MIIAVDFDGTIMKDGRPNIPLIQRLKSEQRRGTTVILWTCRQGGSLNEALAFMRGYGFLPNYINANAPEVIARFGGDTRKVYADVYIDDKAVRI